MTVQRFVELEEVARRNAGHGNGTATNELLVEVARLRLALREIKVELSLALTAADIRSYRAGLRDCCDLATVALRWEETNGIADTDDGPATDAR